MRSLIKTMSMLLTVLLMGAVVHAELQYVENFDTRPIGNLIGATPTEGNNGTVGVTNGTSSGNIQVQLQSGSNVVNIVSNSSGDGRGAGVYNMNDPIQHGEKGVVFFRFYADTSRSVDYYIGIHARTTNINDSALRTAPQNYIIAGFHLWSDGEPAGTMKMVSTNHTATFASGLLRNQWYNCWIEADHATETFNVYISAATGPAGEATLPNPEDKVISDRPFEVATADGLAGMYAVARTLSSEAAPWIRANTQTGNIRIDEIYWDGSQGLTSMTAQKPDPVPGAVNVPVEKVLSWMAPDSPQIAQVLGYDVYMDPNVIKVTNRDPLVLKSAAQTATTYDPTPDMTFVKTYYWVVDTIVTLANDPNDPKVPRVQLGKVWSFTTTDPGPEITSDPADVLVDLGGSASFTAGVSSPYFPATYQWYKSNDRSSSTPADDVLIGGANGLTYTISNAALADEKYYYCAASNVYNSVTYTVKSKPAALGIKRKVAHWTLDGLVGGKYEDISGGGHHADPNGSPVFYSGVNPALTNNAVLVNPNGGWATVGAWDPSEFTGRLTVSMWVKWNGQPSTPRYQGLIGKRSVYATNMRWQLEIGNNAASLLTFKSNINGITGPILPVGEWEQVVVTYDGTTATMYRNGTYAVSGPVTLNDGISSNLVIGGVGLDPAAVPLVATSILDGLLDDIQIYNYALDPVTVAYSFTDIDPLGRKACVDPRDPVLVAYDVNGDCEIGLGDLIDLANHWLEGQLVPDVIARP